MRNAAETVADLWNAVLALVEGAEDWTLATPCPGWRLHDLVGHLSGVQVAFDSGVHHPPPDDWAPAPHTSPLDAWTAEGVAARRDWSRQRLLEELHQARAGHVARVRSVRDWQATTQGPLGPTTEEGLLQVRLYDVWVHLQDLAAAVEGRQRVPDLTAAGAAAQRYVLDRVPWLLARRVVAPEGTPLRVALGAPLDVDRVTVVRDGRGRWEDAGAPPADTVRGDPGAFALLCSGRGTPEHWCERGLLDWSGALGAAFVERARLF